jgi:hypothetical protein
MASIDSLTTAARVSPRPRWAVLSVTMARRRRALQVVLGLIWLLDAALQFQPYMFTKAFASQVIGVNAVGNPALIADPITWSAGLLARHIVVCNALFASIQLLLAVGLLYRPTAKAALAASIPWALGVWWIGEGLGGLLAGTANPVTGAPGAALLYAFLALLAWPPRAGRPPRPDRPQALAGSVALIKVAPRVAWAGLWGSFAYLALLPANRTAGTALAIAPAIASAFVLAVTLAVCCTVAAVTVALGRLTRLGVMISVVLAVVIWIAEDFGGILTGQGTDPNSGLLLIVIAAAFWPVSPTRLRSSRERSRQA